MSLATSGLCCPLLIIITNDYLMPDSIIDMTMCHVLALIRHDLKQIRVLFQIYN